MSNSYYKFQMRKIYFLFVMALSSVTYAQPIPEMVGRSDLKRIGWNKIDNEGFHPCENKEEFQVIFKSPKSDKKEEDMPLTFSSDVDKNPEVITETTSNEYVYYINLPVKDKKYGSYKNRTLTVDCRGFKQLVFKKFNLKNHEIVEYQIYDPNQKGNVPFYRNQAQGDSLLNKFNYDEAHNAYSRCKMFPEYKEEKNKRIIDRQIEKIDSIRSWQKLGDTYRTTSRYKKAIDVYQKILDEMPSDRVAERYLSDCLNNFDMYCSEYMAQAEMYYAEKDFKKAKERYMDIVNMECQNAETARTRARLCDDKINAKLNHNHILLWEIGLKDKQGDAPNTMLPLGITIGNCKPKRGGGYWSVRSHMDATKMINPFNRKKEHGLLTEANMSFGGTGHFVAPGGMKPGLWYHIGVGYTGCGVDLDKTSDEDKYTWKHAISPEVGLIFKWTYFAMKYTFQYRGWINGDKVTLQNPANMEMKLSSIRHYVSIGVAW